MKKITVLSSLALACVAPLTLAADFELDPHWYAGVAYQPFTISTDDAGDFDVANIGVKGGVAFNKFLAAEARYGASVDEDSRTVLGAEVSTELEDYYGAYAKGIIPLHPMFSLYGLAGYTHVNVKSSGPLGSDSASDDGFSYGVGAAFHVNRNVAINAEWMSLIDKDDYDIKGYGVGVSFMF